MSTHNIVYVYRNASNETAFHETAIPGGFLDVLEFSKRLAATTVGFMMGHVLAPDGKVMATVAKDAIRLNVA